MRRFLTLVCLLCLAVPAGISIAGCTRNPDANYCNGLGYGLKITDLASITLGPQTTGISLAFGQTQQLGSPSGKTCKGTSASVASFTYGTTNNQLVDVSPSGNLCAGAWNRNTGGGIANYTYCTKPDPLPLTGGLPYATAYVTASAQSVSSNPVQIYVHAQVTSISLVGPQSCLSQGTLWPTPLDVQACFVGANNTQQVLCAPPSVTGASPPVWACSSGPPTGATVPDCTVALGALSYQLGTSSIAQINTETNQITAEQPGTTAITASVAGSGSSAGYFTTCPPESIGVTLANGGTAGTITSGVTQNLTTTVIDTQGKVITGLSLDYQSTDPVDIAANTGGSITTSFPGVASVYAICQPPTCNPAPINETGLFGTGLSISSNPVAITTPGTASDYLWFAAPGQSQYVVSIELLTGTLSSTVRLPYVPNSMVMDRGANNLYFGSSHELMVFSTSNNTVTNQVTSVPGVVLAVAPNNSTLLINDQARQVFYIYSPSGGASSTFGGLGNAAAWTPDSKTLYVTDSAALNDPPQITGHTDTLYVHNVNTGWSSYPLPPSPLPAGAVPLPPGSQPWSSLPPNVAVPSTMQTPAITIPGVGAYLRGSPTESHTWCPAGTVGNSASMVFYPEGDSVPVQSDTLAATTNGEHILGAALINGQVTISDIGVSIPIGAAAQCPGAGTTTLAALSTGGTLLGSQIAIPVSNADASAVNQVIPSPASNLAFITYTPPATGASTGVSLPYYKPGSNVPGYVTLMNGSSASSTVTAPLAGAFSPDNAYFFVSTAGDNQIHYIGVPTLTDTQQIAPNLPACTPNGNDIGCILAAPAPAIVPATAIAVKPRSTT